MVLLPGVLVLLLLFWQNPGLPYQDDYGAVLNFLVQLRKMPTVPAKLAYITASQHNEYHLILGHAFEAAELALTHHVDFNFNFLIIFGYLFLVGSFYLIWRLYRDDTSNRSCQLTRFVPISLIFFSLTYWENLNWAMTEFQNMAVIFFGLLALDCIIPEVAIKNPWRLFGGCVAACLACCSSANGFLLLPIGMVPLLARRKYGWSIAWIGSFAFPLAAYMYQRVPVAAQPGTPLPPVMRALLFFATLGCAIPVRPVAIVVGLGLAIVLAWAAQARYHRVRPAASSSMVWVLLTVALIAVVRGESGFAIASRYSIYSILALIFAFSFLRSETDRRFGTKVRRNFERVTVALALGFYLVANVHATYDFAKRRALIVGGMNFYREDPEKNSPLVNPAVEKAFPLEKAGEQNALRQAVQLGIYQVPGTRGPNSAH